MNKSAYPKMLVYTVIVILCCGMVTGAPPSSPVHSKIDMRLDDMIISATVDMIVSKYKKVTKDAIPIIYGVRSTSSDDEGVGSLITKAIMSRKPELETCVSAEFNSQLDAILDSARLQLTAEAIKGINALRAEDAPNASDPFIEMTKAFMAIKLEINYKLIDLLMSSGDIVETACNSIIEHVVEYLGFIEEKSKEGWANFLAELVPAITEEINESKANFIDKNTVEARKLLEEHFAMNMKGNPSFDI